MATAPELIQIDIGPHRPVLEARLAEGACAHGENYHNLKTLARSLDLHTVCESAHCPNIGECWNHRTATFMLLGNLCTRRCGFCAVPKGRPLPIDFDEPCRVAEAVEKLALEVRGQDQSIATTTMLAERGCSPRPYTKFASAFPTAVSKC